MLDDALHATRAATEEGIVAGGGTIFLRAIEPVQNARIRAKGDEKVGFDIVVNALKAPTMQIADNAGQQGDVVVAKLLEMIEKDKGMGFDAVTGEYTNMVKAGIVDPAKVARTALEMATSVSGLMLTTNVLITELKEDKKEEELVAGAVC